MAWPPQTATSEFFSEQQPDAAIIAVPTEHHHSVAMAAFAHGIHALVEKPIATNIEDGQAMIDAAASAGTILTVGHVERFNPAVIELKRRLLANELGRVFLIHSRRLSPYPRRIMDVGVAADLASHELDMMRYLTGSDGVIQGAGVSRVLHPTHEDIVFGILRFANGVLGILDVNWITPTKIRDISVTGERGMFTVNYLTQELFFFANSSPSMAANDGHWVLGGGFSVDEGDMTRLHIPKQEPLLCELEAFLHSVKTGDRPVITGADGLHALSLSLDIVDAGTFSQPLHHQEHSWT